MRRLRSLCVLLAWSLLALAAGPAPAAWNVAGPRAKSVQAIARDPLNPSRMWAATMGAGVYRTLDGGFTWTGYRDSLLNTFVRCLAVNPKHPDSVFCGTNDGVFLSVDGGVNWKQRLATTFSVRALAIHPVRTSVVYAATYGLGIYKSLNGGSSWATINLGLASTKVRDIAIHPAKPETLFAATATGGGVHRSFNGGSMWAQVSDTTASVGSAEQIQIDPLNPSRVYAAMYDRGVIRSTDGGATWLRINRGLTSFRCRSLAIVDTLRYVGTDSAGVYFSTLSDTLWHQVNAGLTNGDVEGLFASAASPGTAWAGTDGGGIFRTDNRGSLWTQLDGGMLKTFVFSLAVRPSSHVVYAGCGFGDRFWRSADQGASWVRAASLFSRDSEHGIAPDPVLAQTIYLSAYGQGVYRSDDDGLSWLRPDSLNATLRNRFVRKLVAWPGQAGHLFVGTGGGVYESTDGASTWVPDTLGMPPSFSVRALALVPGSPATLYAGSDSFGVYRSSDGGQTWLPRNTGLKGPFIHDILVDAVSALTVYAATDSGVYKSADGADSWTLASVGLPRGEVRALVQDLAHPQVLFCAVYGGGVFESQNGGASWLAVFNQAGLPTLNVRSLAVDGSLTTLYAGTEAGVAVAANYSLTPTAVEPSAAAPGAYLVVRPVPARSGSAEVVYSLARAGTVSLWLYNARGQTVRRLVSREVQAEGPHLARWDGRDDGGRGVASGVYFARLESPDGNRVSKMVLLPR